MTSGAQVVLFLILCYVLHAVILLSSYVRVYATFILVTDKEVEICVSLLNQQVAGQASHQVFFRDLQNVVLF